MAIRFDVSSIPATTNVVKAELEVYTYDRWGTTTAVKNGRKNLYRITKAWDESKVTWRTPWSKQGGDFSSTAIGQSNTTSINVWEKFDVTNDIKQLVKNPSQNYGFMLVFPRNNYGAKMRSSEYTNTEYRPKLTVTYEKPTNIAQTQKLVKDQFVVKNVANEFKIYIPQNNENCNVALIDARGGVLSSFAAKSNRWHSVGMIPSSGVYFISIKTPHSTIVKKIGMVQ